MRPYSSYFLPSIALLLLIFASFSPQGVLLALPLASIFTSLILIVLGRKHKTWRWAIFASLSWSIEEILWAISRLSQTSQSYPTDLFYFLGAFLWLIALLNMPKKQLPQRNLLLGLPVLILLFWLMTKSLAVTPLLFILTDGLLFLAALLSIESALSSKAHEGRLLWGFGFYVKALAAALYGWLSPDLASSHTFFMLIVLSYLFIGAGIALELRQSRGTLLPALATLVGLELVVGIILFMLFSSSAVSPVVFALIAAALFYLLFFGTVTLLLTDRNQRRKAEARLKNYSQLLEQLLSVRATSMPLKDLLGTLSSILKPYFQDLEHIELKEPEASQSTRYSIPVLTDDIEIAHLYFRQKPKNQALLDAVSPLLANQLEAAIAQLHSQNEAITDPLTSLLNRRGFELKSKPLLERSVDSQTVMSLALIDLDFFKRVNDRYGHDVGDKALTKLADIVKNNIRQGDLAVRWGGEEFLILLFGANVRVTADVVKRISQDLKATTLHPVTWQLTLSAGVIGGFISDHESLLQWIAKADQALLDAKAAGRDRIELAA